jgi:hypothetical protein
MNANGTYNGLDGGAVNGVYNGVNSGVGNGAVSNETKPLNIPILDRFPGAAAAYSLRKLRTQYSGPAIRVRRSSDNTEQDIGFDSNGNLNESQIRGFVGGNDGFVTIWYDQSLNGLNASRAVQADQPRIILSGAFESVNGRTSIEGDSSDYLETASNFTFTHAFTIGKINNYNTINYIVGSATVGLWYGGSSATAQGLGAFDGTNQRTITGEDFNQHLGWYGMRDEFMWREMANKKQMLVYLLLRFLSIDCLVGV